MQAFIFSVVSILSLVSTTAEHVSVGGSQHTGQNSNGFLKVKDRKHLLDELEYAVGAALGIEHGLESRRLHDIRNDLAPMWAALAKDSYGMVDRRSLRYAVHRYFMKIHSMSIIGLDSVHQQGVSKQDVALILDMAPRHVRAMVNDTVEQQGYTINDAVAMIAMLKELVAHHSVEKLVKLYHDRGWDIEASFNASMAGQAVEDYLIRWLIGNDQETLAALDGNKATLESSLESYHDLVHFTRGLVKSYEHSRWKQQSMELQDVSSWRPLKNEFSFQDVHKIIGDMALEFGRFWQTECLKIKDSLIKMDHATIGRIKLAEFHQAALNGDWRFSESKEYLRVIGALDETSSLQGPRVILSNYLQGANNCIASDDHYRMCCPSECEDHMAEIEQEAKGPYATPELILSTVAQMSSSLEEDDAKLSSALRSQLVDIANTHQGTVPLHGRLFAQWLHYVFPRDCPFPHKVGTTVSMTPRDFGSDHLATSREMRTHIDDKPGDKYGNGSDVAAQDDFMSQWSEEEELLSENIRLQAPWSLHPEIAKAWPAAVIAGVCLVMLNWQRVEGVGKGKASCVDGYSMKQHYV